MNMDLWIKQGIPFCCGDTATKLLEQFHQDKENSKLQQQSRPASRTFKFSSLNEENKLFYSRAMASLREWLDAAIVPGEGDMEGASFLLPPCSAFMRRALYESIPNEYPNLVSL